MKKILFILLANLSWAASMPWEIRLTIAESRLFENLPKSEREMAAQAFWLENQEFLREETKSWKFVTPATRILKWQGILAENPELLKYLQGFLFAWMIARTAQNPLVIQKIQSTDQEAGLELKKIASTTPAHQVNLNFESIGKWVESYPDSYSILQKYSNEAKKFDGKIPSLQPKIQVEERLVLHAGNIQNPEIRKRYIQDHLNYPQRQALQEMKDEAVNQAVLSQVNQIMNRELNNRVNQYMREKIRKFQGPFADKQRAYARSIVEQKVKDELSANLLPKIQDQVRNQLDNQVRNQVEIQFLNQLGR